MPSNFNGFVFFLWLQELKITCMSCIINSWLFVSITIIFYNIYFIYKIIQFITILSFFCRIIEMNVSWNFFNFELVSVLVLRLSRKLIKLLSVLLYKVRFSFQLNRIFFQHLVKMELKASHFDHQEIFVFFQWVKLNFWTEQPLADKSLTK